MRNNVKQLRESKDLTQTDLANALNVSRQTIHSIETGKFIPTTLLALKLAKYFNVKVEDIFGMEEGE